MRKNFLFLISYLAIISNFYQSSQIAKKLWGVEYIGEVLDFSYTGDETVLLGTKQGILALMDLANNSIFLKKNFLYENPSKIFSTENCKYKKINFNLYHSFPNR